MTGLVPVVVHPVTADPWRIDLDATFGVPARRKDEFTLPIALAMVGRVIVAGLAQVGQKLLMEAAVSQPTVREFIAGCGLGKLRKECGTLDGL